MSSAPPKGSASLQHSSKNKDAIGRFMIRQLVRTCFGVAALGVSALTVGALLRTRMGGGEWETLTLEDALEGDFCTLRDGVRLHYVMHGPTNAQSAASREPVILIHGLMASSDEWSKVIPALAESRQVWAIDLIGFGFSERVAEPTYSIKYYASSIAEFMDARGIERATVVGHSLGGGVALQFAHDYAARVSRLVLLAPAAYIFRYLKPLQFAAYIPYFPRALISAMLSSPQLHRRALQNAFANPARLDYDMLADQVRSWRVKGTVDALLALSASPHACDLPEGIESVAAPALLVWGDQDALVPLSHGERLVREMPNAELVILEGAGHVPNLECPDLVNRLILNFLDKEVSREPETIKPERMG